MIHARYSRWNISTIFPISVGIITLGMALGRIHVRAQKTLIGYEIGRLKSDESKMLEERSSLKMQLAKLTNRKHLSMMAEADQSDKKNPGSVALK
jgi:regulator of replication initiation timing